MSSLDDLDDVWTYFVDTHEYNFETGNCDLLEYFRYGSEYFQGHEEIQSPTPGTTLSLQVF